MIWLVLLVLALNVAAFVTRIIDNCRQVDRLSKSSQRTSIIQSNVIYSVNGTPVDSVDSLRSTLDYLKTADAIALQVERLGSLHYLVLETDK